MMTNRISCNRSSIEAFIYAAIEGLVFLAAVVILGWYVQSREPVVEFSDDPGYRIIEVAEHFIEVKWIGARLITDCPGRVEPMIVGEYASHALKPYPFIVQHEPKTFTRRYEIPAYFQYGDYELRINMVSQCNPLFEGRQILRVLFRYGPFI